MTVRRMNSRPVRKYLNGSSFVIPRRYGTTLLRSSFTALAPFAPLSPPNGVTSWRPKAVLGSCPGLGKLP